MGAKFDAITRLGHRYGITVTVRQGSRKLALDAPTTLVGTVGRWADYDGPGKPPALRPGRWQNARLPGSAESGSIPIPEHVGPGNRLVAATELEFTMAARVDASQPYTARVAGSPGGAIAAFDTHWVEQPVASDRFTIAGAGIVISIVIGVRIP